jgi:hypothetical protein
LRGTQQLGWYGKPRVDGVFSLWYAKGVGVERAGEAIKAAQLRRHAHSRAARCLLCGDDHAAKASLTAHQSEHVLVTAMAPMLYPATTDEILSMGQLGWALARASGLYTRHEGGDRHARPDDDGDAAGAHLPDRDAEIPGRVAQPAPERCRRCSRKRR